MRWFEMENMFIDAPIIHEEIIPDNNCLVYKFSQILAMFSSPWSICIFSYDVLYITNYRYFYKMVGS